ncbi:MAG: hypothetical protein OET44_02850 [Gammaproteobacteria bacterium]|nr:hypothetical protein [Gammaproteobacteria bacterium]
MPQSREIADNDLALARRAADGDAESRSEVTRLIDPIVQARTAQFCKRFCRENRFRYVCTLADPWGSAPGDAPLCEWGNASYAWMLDDLSRPQRLQRFAARDGAGLRDYLYSIANSLPFYERWKNWRFGRRVHVPTYIAEMEPLAGRVFLALRSGDSAPLIAQQVGCAEAKIDDLSQRIIIELTRRGRLHLLDPPRAESLADGPRDDDNGAQDRDIPVYDPAPEDVEDRAALRAAWQQLTAVEQFVVEAMLIEERDASDVLKALVQLDIRIADDVAPQATDRQQLYYFRRKTVAKLARLMER